MNTIKKIVIGTAQFGMNYGINNISGQVDSSAVEEILKIAGDASIRYIDTAFGYGNSEEVLGNTYSFHNNSFNTISKYAKSVLTPIEQFEMSLKRLKVKKIYAYMVHNFSTYSANPKIWEDFMSLKSSGRVEKIGFSLYSTEELDYLLNENIDIDIVQVPYNILDRQFENWFSYLHSRNIEVQTRSVFLQGIFFKNIDSFQGNTYPLAKYVNVIQIYCKQNSIRVQDLALSFSLASSADGVLIGVDNIEQLKENIKSSNRVFTAQDKSFINTINVTEKRLLSPVNW